MMQNEGVVLSRNRLEQLEESRRREQQFASDVAHELRTPEASMPLVCEDMLRGPGLRENLREELLLLERKAVSLSRMVSQMLMLSRADQGRLPVEKERLDLGELVQEAVQEAKEVIEAKRVSIRAHIHPGPTIMEDETLLIRFWMNLLDNAVKYSREGGNVSISLKRGPGRIEGSVSDDGIGIDEKSLPHIWERFYQADPSRTENGSSGLGLSMVKWIAGARGGRIEASCSLFWKIRKYLA